MSGNRKSILLVEDEAIIAMMEKMEMEGKGYIVHHVRTGEEAVKTVRENSFSVDLILMDIDLGSGMDGTQAARQILDQKDIPVIFLSSHTEPEVVEKTEKITSCGYVVKNSGVFVLDASIKMALKLFDSNMKTKLINEKLESTVENLRAHQVELQMQNEELSTKQAELEALRLRYFNLYDMAPAGYCSISGTGLILEANLTAAGLLGITRSALLKQRFSSFIINEDQDIFYMHRKKLFDAVMPQSCELRMRRNDGSVFPVYMKAVPADDDNGSPVCHVIMIEHDAENEKEGRV